MSASPSLIKISDYAQRIDGLYCALPRKLRPSEHWPRDFAPCGGVYLVTDSHIAGVQLRGEKRFQVHCHKCNNQGFECDSESEILPHAQTLLQSVSASELYPLFLPLDAEYFDAFAAGTKEAEYRLYGPRWNEKTCLIGRRVTLSRGYGRYHRFSRIITDFQTLTEPPDPDAWSKCFGDKKAPIAAITLSPAP